MLIVESYFATFTKKPLADAHKSTETVLTFSTDSKEQVDSIVHKAKAAGGTIPMDLSKMPAHP